MILNIKHNTKHTKYKKIQDSKYHGTRKQSENYQIFVFYKKTYVEKISYSCAFFLKGQSQFSSKIIKISTIASFELTFLWFNRAFVIIFTALEKSMWKRWLYKCDKIATWIEFSMTLLSYTFLGFLSFFHVLHNTL